MTPPPARRVPPPARRTPPPAVTVNDEGEVVAAPTGGRSARDAELAGPDGKTPTIRLYPSSNLWSIMSDVRGALRATDAPAHVVDEATVALLKAPSGTYADVAAKYVTIAPPPSKEPA